MSWSRSGALVDFHRLWHWGPFRCEPHDREIAEGRDRSFAIPPLSQVATLGRFLTGCHSTFSYPTIQDHLYVRSAHEEPDERPVKLGVVPVYDNEQLYITDFVRAHLDDTGCECCATTVRLLPRPRNCAPFDVSRGQAEAVGVGS
jgi:hypothetical protein